MTEDVRHYVMGNFRGACPPEYLDVVLMRECNLKPQDLGHDGPVTVGMLLGWLAAIQGEGAGREILQKKLEFEHQAAAARIPQIGRP